MTDKRIAQLVARYGWRLSSIDCKLDGIEEVVLQAACFRGEAKLERSNLHVRTYVVFA